MPKKTHLSKAPEYQPGVEIEGFNSVVRDLVAVAGSKKAWSWGTSSTSCLVVGRLHRRRLRRSRHADFGPYQAKFSPPPTSPLSSSRKAPSRATMRAFMKPIHFLIEVLKIIPHRIKTRNVPRLKNCKGRMELAMDLAMDLEEGEGFSAGKVA